MSYKNHPPLKEVVFKSSDIIKVMSVVRAIQKVIQRGRERVFLVEETEKGYVSSLYTVSEHDHSIYLNKQKKISSLEYIGKTKLFWRQYDRIVLAFQAKRVATVESSISVSRVHPESLITEGELDGLLFHALWSFLNKFRPLAAKKLNTTELDLVIANIAVFGVRLQGHTVFNPLDFSGKDIEFFFRVSFISRSLLPSLEKIAKYSHIGPVVVERGAILASIASKPGILFVVDEQNTNWYEMGNECGFRGSFMWGYGDIYKALGDMCGVSSQYAKHIIERFCSHRISLKIQGNIEKTIREEYKKFRDCGDASLATEHHELLRGEARVIHFEDQLISSLFLSDERYKIADSMLFTFQDAAWSGDCSLSSSLTVFPYVHPQYEYLNQLLRRRAKWLVPLDTTEKEKKQKSQYDTIR